MPTILPYPFACPFFQSLFRQSLSNFSPIIFIPFFPIPIPSSSLQSLFPSFSPNPFLVLLSYPYSYPASYPFTIIFFISCSLLFLQSFSLSFLLSNTFPINISNPISYNNFIGEGKGRNTTPKVVLSYANIR